MSPASRALLSVAIEYASDSENQKETPSETATKLVHPMADPHGKQHPNEDEKD